MPDIMTSCETLWYCNSVEPHVKKMSFGISSVVHRSTLH